MSAIPLTVEMLDSLLEAEEKLHLQQMQPMIYIGEVVGGLFRAFTKKDIQGCCEFLESFNRKPMSESAVQRAKDNFEQMVSMFMKKGGGEDGNNAV